MVYLAMLVLTMRVSVIEVAATSFALIVATHALGTTMGSSLLGYASETGGFPLMFGISAALIFVAGLMTAGMSESTAGPAPTLDEAGPNQTQAA